MSKTQIACFLCIYLTKAESSIISDRFEVNVPRPIFTDTKLSSSSPYEPSGLILSSPALRKLVASCAGRMEMDLDSLDKFGLPWQYSRPQNPHMINQISNGNAKLPSRPTMERYARRWFSSVHFLVFPVISLDLFERTLDLVYGSRDVKDYTGSVSAKAALYAFLSIVTIIGFTKQGTSHGPSGEFYAAKAQSYLVDIVQESTMDGLQALTSLVSLYIWLGFSSLIYNSIFFFLDSSYKFLWRLQKGGNVRCNGISHCVRSRWS